MEKLISKKFFLVILLTISFLVLSLTGKLEQIDMDKFIAFMTAVSTYILGQSYIDSKDNTESKAK